MQDNPDFLDMQQNGVITYLTESNNTFQVEKNLQLKLVRMDRNFARLFFVRNVAATQETAQEAKMSLDGTGIEPAPANNWVQIAIPAQYTLTDISGGREVSTHTFSLYQLVLFILLFAGFGPDAARCRSVDCRVFSQVCPAARWHKRAVHSSATPAVYSNQLSTCSLIKYVTPASPVSRPAHARIMLE